MAAKMIYVTFTWKVNKMKNVSVKKLLRNVNIIKYISMKLWRLYI